MHRTKRTPYCASVVVGFAALAIGSLSAQASPWRQYEPGRVTYNEASGDFDGDGHRDRVVAFPNYDSGRGLVGAFFGTGDPQDFTYHRFGTTSSAQGMDSNIGGLAHSMRIDLEGTVSGTDAQSLSDTHPGADVVSGDFNADGFDDLAIGVPGAPVTSNQGTIANAGSVWVLHGKASGLSTSADVWHQNRGTIMGVAEANDGFGAVVESGDVNCDGFDDLIVGVPQEDSGTIVDAGWVHVLYGSAAGLTDEGNEFFDQNYRGSEGVRRIEARDYFGAALATGSFNGKSIAGGQECSALAIGAPGEDVARNGKTIVNAGAVHVLYPPAKPKDVGTLIVSEAATKLGGIDVVLHQDVGSLKSGLEDDDQFGAQLGRVPPSTFSFVGNPYADDLWIGVPGEEWFCPTHNERGVTQIVNGNAGGIQVHNDKITCQSVRPDLHASERGLVVERVDAYGRWLQYVPTTIDPSTAKVLVVVHGTPPEDWTTNTTEQDTFTPGRGAANYYMSYPGFVAAAEVLNLVVLMPQFEQWNFGAFDASVNGSYRALAGRDIGADQWAELIVDRYAAAGLGGRRFFLVGHSAGGQFTNRYVMHNDDRLLGASIMSPGSVTWPNSDSWPGGMSPYTGNRAWQVQRAIQPSTASAADTLEQVKVTYVVGEGQSVPDANGTPIPNQERERRETAQLWVEVIEDTFGVKVPLCVLDNVNHSSFENHFAGLRSLFPELSDAPGFGGGAPCLIDIGPADLKRP